MQIVVISVFCLFVSASNLFLYFYFGERTTQNYLSFGDAIYESELHRLPVRLQKPLIMMIAVTQWPAYCHGFGWAYLNLYTFGRAIIIQWKCETWILIFALFFSTFTDASNCLQLLHGLQNANNRIGLRLDQFKRKPFVKGRFKNVLRDS